MKKGILLIKAIRRIITEHGEMLVKYVSRLSDSSYRDNDFEPSDMFITTVMVVSCLWISLAHAPMMTLCL